LLKWIPDGPYVYARGFSEGLVYTIFFLAAAYRLVGQREVGKKKKKFSPLTIPFLLFLLAAAVSSFLNDTNPVIALFGIRQLGRWVLLFFAAAWLSPHKMWIKKLTLTLFVVVALQSIVGMGQALTHGAWDAFFLPSEDRVWGDLRITEGVDTFGAWTPGARVFGTLGRYDRLGTFLAFFLLLSAGFLYESRKEKRSSWSWKIFLFTLLLGLPALTLTASRSAWFGFLFGFLFMALMIKRDRRVAVGFIAAVFAAMIFLSVTKLPVGQLTERAGQPLTERFFEAFSFARWQSEYTGLGRTYWAVETFRSVLTAAPFFGHGPGNYGGGVVALFHNTRLYNTLAIPFGIYGTAGYIDNNWLSLLGETGIIGFGLYLWMWVSLFLLAFRRYRREENPCLRAMTLGFMGALIAASVNAFLATFLEIRTLMVYVWLYGGLIAGTQES
jgi:hypothetical protein